jgi:hypothetical protein
VNRLGARAIGMRPAPAAAVALHRILERRDQRLAGQEMVGQVARRLSGALPIWPPDGSAFSRGRAASRVG